MSARKRRSGAKIADIPHADLLFESDYLRCADLRGQRVTVEIEDIDPNHELHRRPKKGEKKGSVEHKPVVFFKGKDKGLVLNKTNTETLARLHGSKPSAWIGKRVVLFPDMSVKAFGKVGAVRIEAAQ